MKLRAATFAALGSVLLTGLLVAPAGAAATRTSISVHVQNIKGQALKDVSVHAYQGGTTVVVGRTNAKGNLTKASGTQGRLSGGYWRLYLEDDNPARLKARTAYAPKTLDVKLGSGKNLDLKTRTLATGTRVLATVTTPSGLPVVGATVQLQRTADLTDVIEWGTTYADGKLLFFAIPTMTYYLRARIGALYTYAIKLKTKPGTTQDAIWSKVQVPCRTSFGVAPGAEAGSVLLRARASASDYGVETPGGGKATILRDGTFHRYATFQDGSLSLKLGDQAPGDHTFAVKYAKGDCRDWKSPTKTVSVEAPAG